MLKKIQLWIASSLQIKMALQILLAMSILLAVFVIYDINMQRSHIEEALYTKGKSMAMSGALTMSHILEDAIATGRLTEEQIFDTNYQLIPNTDPPKYHTAYDSFTDANFQSIEDGYLLDEDVLFSVAVDINGYLPTHNSKYSQALTGDLEKDIEGNRTKRLFNDPTGIAAAKNTEPVLQQKYNRDTGEKAWDISSPIFVNGKHWGAFRVAFLLTRVDAQMAIVLQNLLIASLLMVIAIALAAFILTRTVTMPLGIAVNISKSLAVGNLVRELSEKEKNKVRLRQDEIGDLGKAFDKLINYMQEMGQTAEIIARNDLTVSVEPKSEKDELGNAFVGMIDGLRDAVTQINNNAGNLSSASEQLARIANQAGLATNQISNTVQQVAKGTSDQAESITTTAFSVEQMSRAIEGVAKGAQEQSQAITKASEITAQINIAIQQVAGNAASVTTDSATAAEAARGGAQTVEETLQGMQSIKSKVGASAEKVQEMGQRSGEIGAIVETIEDIASQTNLLALNAAIEAARAGEHGKGFAVVADEVRKLAERSSQATKEIGTLIGDIQNTVADAVKAMDEGSREVELGVASANRAGSALTEILSAAQAVNTQAVLAGEAAGKMNAFASELVSAVDSVSAVVEENTAATEEMAANSTEVTQAIESIASVSEENSAAIEEVSASAEEMSAQVEEVTDSARSLAELAQELQKVVNRFKLNIE